ncbi:MAG: acyl-CoA dehydrogenase family protein [Actinomycetota bacterium]|nr:acyl-CoA dehydrogenase family protein [Actinomycetota bacterium]
MQFTEQHEEFRRSVRGVMRREIEPFVDEWEAAGAFPGHQVWKTLGAAGLLGLEYDPAYGGQGAEHSYTVIFGEELGRIGCGGVPMAITAHTDMALDKLGMRSSDTAELSFVDARVPVANTIGQVGQGFGQQMRQFQNERMIAAYTAVGAMSEALARTRSYLGARHAFGRPLLANQYLRYRLAELTAELDVLRHYNYACAEAYMRGEDTTRFATIAKLKTGRLQREVADTCLQFHGGVGYMSETWVSRFFRDGRLLSIGGGADEVMLQVLSKLDDLGA